MDHNINGRQYAVILIGDPFTGLPRKDAVDAHTRIHKGQIFSVGTIDISGTNEIAIGSTLDLVITANAGNYPHVTFDFSLGGAGKFLVYELPDVNVLSGGSSLQVTNKKWNSVNAFNGDALKNPTINMTGATLKHGCIVLGTTTNSGKPEGGSGSFDSEFILQPGKPCLIRLVNDTAAAINGCLYASLYNSDQIADS